MAHFPAHHDHSPQRGRGGVSRYPGGAQLFGGNNVKCQTAFPFMCRVTSMWGRWTALSPTFSQALTEQPGRRGLSIVPGGCAVTPDWPEDSCTSFRFLGYFHAGEGQGGLSGREWVRALGEGGRVGVSYLR